MNNKFVFYCINFIIIIIYLVIISCVSTPKKTSYIKKDEIENYVYIYTAEDPSSALPNPRYSTDLAKTLIVLKNHVSKNPNDIRARLDIAQIYLVTSNLDLAKQECQKILERDIRNFEARKILAKIAFKKKNYDLALIILNSLGGESSKDSEILNIMALIAIIQNKMDVSLSLLKKALTLNPANIAVRMNLGVLYLKYRQLSSAATQFERVLKQMPENIDAKLHLAIIQSAKGDIKNAERVFKEVLAVRPNNPIALFNLAVLQKNKQDYDNALSNLKKFLKTDYAKVSNVEPAFALIDEIQNLQEANGMKSISDEEISKLAQEIKKKPRLNSDQNNINDFSSDDVFNSSVSTNTNKVDEEILDDINALEKELAH